MKTAEKEATKQEAFIPFIFGHLILYKTTGGKWRKHNPCQYFT